MSNKHKISVMISEDKLQEKIAEIGAKISADYEGKEIKLICILKGSIFFCCELAKRITVPVKIDFMQTSSYGSGTTSSGNIVIKKELDESIEGEHVTVVEDIIEDDKLLIMNLYSKYKAIYQYFDDWIVIKTDENYEDITEIIAKKKEKHHIETNVW